MGTVVYATVNGRVLSQTRSGVRSLYSLDPLGNTRALYDNTGAKTDTFTYTPFGTVATHVGTTSTPFQWNGGSGYYQNSATRVYVRARNYYVNLGKWSTQDPIGFDGDDYNLYRYIKNRVVTLNDPSGLLACSDNSQCPCGCTSKGGICLCGHGDNDRHSPPDCSKLGNGCKPVFFTCNPTDSDKTLAVYCDPGSCCNDKYCVVKDPTSKFTTSCAHGPTKVWRGYRRVQGGCVKGHFRKGELLLPITDACERTCPSNGKRVGPPIFPLNKPVCIIGSHGPQNRIVDDCGCGQLVEKKPIPDNWMDWEGDCDGFDNGWRCVCPGECPKVS